MTYDIENVDKIQFIKPEDIELEPDDIIRMVGFQNYCEHPEWRRCLAWNSDKVIYECVECSFVRESMPKPKPLSQDQWI